MKITKRGARCQESAPTSSILADKTKYDDDIKHNKSRLKRKLMLPEVRNSYQRGPVASKISRKTIILVEIKSLIDFYRPFIDLIDQIFDKSLYID